jgi:hypothetical protein
VGFFIAAVLISAVVIVIIIAAIVAIVIIKIAVNLLRNDPLSVFIAVALIITTVLKTVADFAVRGDQAAITSTPTIISCL